MIVNSETQGNKNIRVQCVEYIRSWLRKEKGMVYGDVEIATDIWDRINYYRRVSDGHLISVASIPNGSRQPPKIGDLVIYCKEFLGIGHVAVISEIDLERNVIGVCEYDYGIQHRHPEQRRYISLISFSGCFWILDAYVIGWKQIQNSTTMK